MYNTKDYPLNISTFEKVSVLASAYQYFVFLALLQNKFYFSYEDWLVVMC